MWHLFGRLDATENRRRGFRNGKVVWARFAQIMGWQVHFQLVKSRGRRRQHLLETRCVCCMVVNNKNVDIVALVIMPERTSSDAAET